MSSSIPILGVLVVFLFVFSSCSYSVLVPVLVCSCSGLVLFWLCSGSVCGSGGSVCVPWGSSSSPSLGPNCGSVLGPVDIFKFLLRKKGWLVLI